MCNPRCLKCQSNKNVILYELEVRAKGQLLAHYCCLDCFSFMRENTDQGGKTLLCTPMLVMEARKMTKKRRERLRKALDVIETFNRGLGVMFVASKDSEGLGLLNELAHTLNAVTLLTKRSILALTRLKEKIERELEV